MRRLLLFILASGIVFFGSKGIRQYLHLVAAPVPEPKPFTAQVREDKYAANGRMESVMFTHAQRADGSTATVEGRLVPNGNHTTLKVIVDLSAKKRIIANGLTESLSTRSMSDDQVLHERKKATSCSLQNTGESGVFFGLPVYRVYKTSGTDTIDTWAAPDLGCFPVKVEAVRRGADGSRAFTTQEVVNVIRGEPDPSLFALPGWVEMDPIAQSAEYTRRYGRPLYSDESLDKLQRLYLRTRR